MRELEDRVEVERAQPLRMRWVETAALEYQSQRLRYMRVSARLLEVVEGLGLAPGDRVLEVAAATS